MSSTIVPSDAIAAPEAVRQRAATQKGERKDPFLIALGERVRALRARRGMTRKALAAATDVSERHLANLEYGVGNASVLVLLQVTRALHCSFAELLGDVTTLSPEWLLMREMLENRDEATLRRVRVAVGELLGTGPARGARPLAADRPDRPRGAGKSTLGRMLAEDLDFPFVELTREIEKMAGCSTAEILGLYGQNAYRRYERRALEEAVQIYPGGGHRDRRRHGVRPRQLQPAAAAIAPPSGCRPTRRTTWRASPPRATCGRWRRAPRRWRI